ncbi:CcdB family protein [Buttiauxella izardii]|uniref:Toxin CcdB n=1 Tax=Buttiauxella izardii TaxID=82991 RepID=A0A3A5JLD9_9ENTR|nr:CcdB family protein [Buttiauxella izardii]RJT19668.1 taxon MazF [Buttiauxella izardii]
MEQFIAYENKGIGKSTYPYLINIHHPVANILSRVVVIPVVGLQRLGMVPPKKACPVITIAGHNCVAMTHMIAGIPEKELGRPVQDLNAHRHTICDAVDFIVNGY